MSRTQVRMVEGVPYHPFLVRFYREGKRKRRTLWSPGPPWLGEEICRMLRELEADPNRRITVFIPRTLVSKVQP